MQHHAHGVRMRGQHGANATATQHIQTLPMSIVGTAPPPPVVNHQQPQQKQQQHSNALKASTSQQQQITTITNSTHAKTGIQQQQQQTSHNNRLNQQYTTTTTQQQQHMPKGRQHQNHNNYNNINKNHQPSYHNPFNQQANALSTPQQQLQQQQQQQHQRNIPQQLPSHTMQPPYTQSRKNHLQQNGTNVIYAQNNYSNGIKQQQYMPGMQQQQQENHYYNNNNNKNIKYNNNNNNNNNSNVVNNNTNYITPKSILQNPGRATKPRTPHADVNTNESTAVDAAATPQMVTNNEVPVHVNNQINKNNNNNNTNNCNNITPIMEPPLMKITPIVSAKIIPMTTINEHESETNSQTDQIANDPAQQDSNKENIASTSSTTENNRIVFNHILPNEDSSVSKGSKEKTPMCLVNELARYNKITHQYRLQSEKGPAHCKRFTVTLKLGEEEYSAEGYKIKKAQHLAAAEAIEKTKYKHPLPKNIRRMDENGATRANVTPTVELNALAMKLGQQTYYLFHPRPVETTLTPGDNLMPAYNAQGLQPPPHMMAAPPNSAYMRRNHMPHVGYMPPPSHLPGTHPRYGVNRGINFQPKFRYTPGMLPPPPPPLPAAGNYNGLMPKHHHYSSQSANCKITLIVGKQKFIGTGRTLQHAKHDAAARALQVIKAQAINQTNEMLDTSAEEKDSKSPISVVFEIGIKRNMSVNFKILREEGPAHMRVYIIACIVGNIVTEGEGNGKKIAKKRAAEKMIEELKKLPPLTPTKSPTKRIRVKTPGKGVGAGGASSGSSAANERRNKRGVASGASGADAATVNKNDSIAETDDENPVTKLIQIQQNRKEKEPVFEMIAKNGMENPRRREFIVEVTAQGMVARGTGSNKKIAKRNAAQNLLLAIEEKLKKTNIENQFKDTAQHKIQEEVIHEQVAAQSQTVAATEINNTTTSVPISTILNDSNYPLVTTSAGPVPGILILRQNKKHAAKKKEIAVSNAKTDALHNQAGTNTSTNDMSSAATPIVSMTTPVVSAVNTTICAATPVVSATTPAGNPFAAGATPVVNTAVCGATLAVNENPFISTAAPVINAASSTICAVTTALNATMPVVTTEKDTTKTTVPSTNTSLDSSISSTATATTTVESEPKSISMSSSLSTVDMHMKEQLLYLAKLLDFEVSFCDYPKGNHNDFLTIVTLTTTPPQICHGIGSSAGASQNDAAKNALKILSQLGLNNAKK